MPEKERYYTDIVAGLAERTIKRLWIVILVLATLLVATNAGWIYYESQFQTEQVEIRQINDDGYNNYIGNDGEIIYGNTDDHD